MYNNYFGFQEKPFKLVPNPEYLFLSKTHEIALAHLTYSADQGDGFVVIIGEVGTGKTTLCRNYLEGLDDETDSAYIFNPHLEKNELLTGICHEYGIRTSEKGTKALLSILYEFLIKQNAAGRKVVLLIDEAQLLSIENLEMVRMFSNLETTKKKLLQIILVGQPELAGKLETYELRQLAQRISLNYELTPLSAEDTEAYIQHRIGVASNRYSQLFSPDACRLTYRYSKGIPRLINIAADRALLVAFSQNKPKVTKSVMKTAIAELLATTASYKEAKSKRINFWGRVIGAAVLTLCVVVFVLYINDITPFKPSPADKPSPAENVPPDGNRGDTVEKNTFKVPFDSRPATTIAQSPPEPEGGDPGAGAVAESMTGSSKAPPLSVGEVPVDLSNKSTSTGTSAVTPIDHHGVVKLLGGLDPYASRKNSAAMLLHLWKQSLANVDLIPDGVDNSSFFDIAARQYGLRRYEVSGDWGLVRRIALPAILTLELPNQVNPVFVSLIGLRGNNLRLADRLGGDVFEVDFQALKPYIKGDAHIFWKNILGFDMIIRDGSDDRAVMMVKSLLQKVGYANIELSPEFDYATRYAIRDFQQTHQIKVDGLVGPLTKIMLLRDAGTFEMPQLHMDVRLGS
jgi:general secretion pathway protein A